MARNDQSLRVAGGNDTGASVPPRHAATHAAPWLVTRPLLWRFVTIFGASGSFYLLLSVVPAYTQAAGHGTNAAGFTTGALMLATVCGEVATPRLAARYGLRLVLGAGLVLLGAPALLLTVSQDEAWIMAICAARGLGFAATVVAGGALTTHLLPAERRGEGLALVGVVGGVPSLVGLPLGIWLANHVGYASVSLAATGLALGALVAIPGLPRRDITPERPIGVLEALHRPDLTRPALVFAATTVAAGVIVTFLPLGVGGASTELVAVALVVQPATSTAARWMAGRHGDRHGPVRLVMPGLVTSAAGILLLARSHNALAVLSGVALFGVGFGVTQNATLTLMYQRVTASGYGAVSALWNLAYDGGMGAGAVGFGLLAGRTGYPLAFAVTAAVMLTVLPFTRHTTLSERVTPVGQARNRVVSKEDRCTGRAPPEACDV